MIVTVEDHELFETLISSAGLSKSRTQRHGSLSIHMLNGKKVGVFHSRPRRDAAFPTKDTPTEKAERVCIVSEGRKIEAAFSAPWIEQMLAGSHPKKEYTVRTAQLTNGVLHPQIFYVDSADTRTVTAVEGMDHASEIFAEIKVHVTTAHEMPQTLPSEARAVSGAFQVTEGVIEAPVLPEPEKSLLSFFTDYMK